MTSNNTTNKNISTTDIENNKAINSYEQFVADNPDTLPITVLINDMQQYYEPFVTAKEQHTNELSLTDIFYVPAKYLKKENKCEINTSFEQTKDMSLAKLLAYSLLSATLGIFEKSGKNKGQLNMVKFKEQIGRDIPRIDIKINDVSIPKDIKDDDSTQKTTDNFNEYIMSQMKLNQTIIEQNNITIIDATIGQGIFILLGEAIDKFVLNKIGDSFVQASRGEKDKSMNFNLTKEKQHIIFKTEMNLVDPYEIKNDKFVKRGSYSFSLTIDLNAKSFSLDQFDLEYIIPEPIGDQSIGDQSIGDQPIGDQPIEHSTTQSNLKKYTQGAYNIVQNNPAEFLAGVTTTGVASVGALYLAGILGGKVKTKTKKQGTNRDKQGTKRNKQGTKRNKQGTKRNKQGTKRNKRKIIKYKP